ncbi:phosphogluconate dehydrogenase (decarboxylating), Cterminal domain containing protein [Acanthamoeba castellanii str. Neff]|uniref:6-phosphogluconate dehydrogenase, decarboxylating n=1 Tax=Acanthamoeba castellanii (strain ATCC 30010 / Neff) TaxID=1257118 RepID=L8GP85_ACACF|nr:phosphogluconate dehydrogenase (decarboxylating), Cterminal domain containing protein [Acanthamoeba castellanii str. Neff]ELR14458.1 phosphogluconate dehydrogenase (decarboxylating), Cterminal domain containing protein [Acanthamoeba castellanii str. Neff]
MAATADIGLVGLAVMGENLVLNMLNHGFTVAVDNFVSGRAAGKSVVGCHSLEDLVKSIKRPRKVMLMVMAGEVVDIFINALAPLLEEGDIIIDGGNSHFPDSNRRTRDLAARGLHFVGAGVSGGEEGALLGPSIMPGGACEAWEAVKPIFQAIAARVEDGSPCCDWVGQGGAGHFVKMVHNGIEYGDMQLICEVYFVMKHLLGMGNDEMHAAFAEWNRGELNSYLIEITAEILAKRDDEQPDAHVVDLILDTAGQKGTGKWTVEAGLDFGAPVTLIGEAVFARTLSSLKADRTAAAAVLAGPAGLPPFAGDRATVLGHLKDALYASKLVSYAQGFMLMRAADAKFDWKLNYGGIALMWRGGCIIRSTFLGKIKEAFDRDPALTNLLLDPFFRDQIDKAQAGWRKITALAVEHGVPAPAIASAISFYDAYRTARLPANLLQAQRDYFGAHTYERVDRDRGLFFHTNWTGRGGATHSTTYNV